MNQKEKEVQYYVYQTDLKELFLALWKRKIMIIGLSLIVAIAVALFSKFFITPIYDTKLNIIINMPEIYKTRYGDYQLPIMGNDQYLNLIKSNNVIKDTIKDMNYNMDEISIEDMKERVTIVETKNSSANKQNSFEVLVSASNPNESLKLAQTLYKNYIEFIDVMALKGSINYFYNDFSVRNRNLQNQLDSVKEILRRNEELLREIPKTISDDNTNIEMQGEINDLGIYTVPIYNINLNYIKMENDILHNKQSINEIENEMRMDNIFLEELSSELKGLKEYYETKETVRIDSKILSSIAINIYLPSVPVAPTYKTSPNVMLNTALGATIGLFIGIMISLVREYWLIKE